MNPRVIASMAACAVAGLGIGLAPPAMAAPTEASSAQDTVNRLEAAGYDVILNKTGTAPLDSCTVTAVRQGQEITQRRTDSTDPGSKSVDTVVHSTVFVDLSC